MSQLSGAMTNLIYRCRYQRGGEVTILCSIACASIVRNQSSLSVCQGAGSVSNFLNRIGFCNLQKLFALARVFGNIPDDLFSRAYEAMIFRTVARAGMGPKLLVGTAEMGACATEHQHVTCIVDVRPSTGMHNGELCLLNGRSSSTDSTTDQHVAVKLLGVRHLEELHNNCVNTIDRCL